MAKLSVSDAVALVRKNIDEIGLNDSVMYSDDNKDNTSLDLIIKKTLPEVINEVNLSAPIEDLEGENSGGDIEEAAVDADGVLSFTFSTDHAFLRLVKFQAPDSDQIVTDVIAEASPEGRKQLNKTIRGTYDKPRLVMLQGSISSPKFKYYSLKNGTQLDEGTDTVKGEKFVMEAIDEQRYAESTTEYPISRALTQTVINALTARVLIILGETEKAKAFLPQTNQSE